MEKWVIRPQDRTFSVRSVWYLLTKKPIVISCLRPLPLLAAAAAGGVIAASATGWQWLLPLFSGFLLWINFGRLVWQKKWLAFALPVVFAASAIHTLLILLPAQIQASQLSKKDFKLQGVVCSLVNQEKEGGQVLVQLASGVKVALTYFGQGQAPQYGSRIAADVQGFLPRKQRNPGGFDESAWLAAQGVFLKARLIEGGQIEVVRAAPAFNPMLLGDRLQKELTAVFRRMLDQSETALLAGLLFGDTSSIEDQTRADFRKAGIAHLMSVSGANVSLFLLPAGNILKKSRIGRKMRIWLLLATLIGFGFVTGWQVSVSRAILMTGCVLAGRLLHRQADAISALSFAALLLLICWPLTALTTGFWLSLTATASLLLFAEPMAAQMQKYLPALPRSVTTLLASSLSIQMFLLPLLAQTSQEVSLVGLLVNLPAVPLAAAISLAAAVLMPFALAGNLLANPAIDILLNAACRPLAFALKLLAGLAEHASRIQAGRISAISLNSAFWLTWLFLVAIWISRTWFPAKSGELGLRMIRRLRLPALAAGLLLGLFSWISQPEIKVWFLDVGQGDAVLIQAKTGETVLIDSGNTGQGYAVLLPALDALGITQVDLAISTHGHADHDGGFFELIKARRIKMLMVSKEESEDMAGGLAMTANDLTDDLILAAEEVGIQVSELSDNDTIVLGSLISLQIVNLMSAPAELTPETDINSYSLIIQANLSGHNLLLTADCTQDVENQMLSTGRWPTAEILKVAHHGSRMTTSDAFLAKVQPQASIISVGPNFYGHPSPDTVQRLAAAGTETLRTDIDGALLLTITHESWQISPCCP